jgi:hypothetical protein
VIVWHAVCCFFGTSLVSIGVLNYVRLLMLESSVLTAHTRSKNDVVVIRHGIAIALGAVAFVVNGLL